MTSYWFAARPKGVEHQHPFLIFDGSDRLHLPLTIFGKEASRHLSPQTVPTYLHALLPFFAWLDTDVWQTRAGISWDAPPKQVRQAVEDYLVSKLQCKVHPHYQGWKFVAITTGTRSTLRVFLSALKLFYQIMAAHGLYPFFNPLVEPVSATIATVEARLEQEGAAPKMPDRSGVVTPQKKPAHRLSDNYFKLKHDEWVPHILDDPFSGSSQDLGNTARLVRGDVLKGLGKHERLLGMPSTTPLPLPARWLNGERELVSKIKPHEVPSRVTGRDEHDRTFGASEILGG